MYEIFYITYYNNIKILLDTVVIEILLEVVSESLYLDVL